ncbi:MAG: GWxTD domain-containing protein [Candidatus Krumholzibacteriia bacterium]
MRRTAFGLLLCSGVFLAALSARTSASESERLRQITDKWREARAAERPLEVYLRPIVAEDPNFMRDAGLALERLSEEMRETYDALQYLLSSSLKAQFVGLSTDSLRSEWLRRYWRLRDPTPTTPENEHRREHERRVEKARKEYAWKQPPGWDARGQVFIMFGEPDSIIEEVADVRMGLGYVPARQDWLFFDEEWVAQFERPNPRGPWVLGRSSPTLSSRPDIVEEDKRRLGYDDGDLAYASGREREGDLLGLRDERTLLAEKDLDERLSPEIVEHEIRTDLRARELLRKRQDAISAFTKEFEQGNDRFVLRGEPKPSIWYVFDVDIFKGPPGRMHVEVHYQFNMQDLTFKWQDSLYVAKYSVEGLLLDRSVRETARDRYTETLQAQEFRSTLAARLLPGQLEFDVPEGRYRLAIRFVDEFSNGEGTYLTDVEVPRLDGSRLALSDIEMATKIVYAGEDWHSRFVKNDRFVVPNPIGIYRREKQLTGYFEIYGLQLDESNVCHYKVTYSIVPRSLARVEGWFPDQEFQQKPFVTSSFMGEAGTSELVEDLRIDISALEEDAYDIVLTVRDLIAGTEATARSAFSILE